MNVAQIEASDIGDRVFLSTIEYQEYLKLEAHRQSTTPVSSVAQTGNPVALVSRSSSLGPWIPDSGASDHMTSNQLLFSHLNLLDTLPNVTSANGSQTKCQDIG